MSKDRRSDFERVAETEQGGNLIVEFWEFLRHNKKWWLLPILLVLLAVGAILLAASTGVAPFLYPLF